MVNKLPRISVIIPTWNREEFIGNAIKSVLNQTIPVKEIIVCDDGSTDKTIDLIQSRFGEKVRILRLAHNGRPSIPRNRGIAAATGDYVAFLDSDDEWVANKLELQLNELLKTKSDGCATNAFRLIPGIGIVGNLIELDKDQITLNELLHFNQVISSSIILKRSLLDIAGRFPEGPQLSVGEDYVLWLKILSLTDNFSYINSPLVIYRDSPSDSIRVKSKNIALQNFYIYSNYFGWLLQRSPIQAAYIFLKFIFVKLTLNFWRVYFKFYECLANLKGFLIGQGVCDLSNTSASINITSNNHPLVSVIMPVFNAEAYIGEAIQSILNQSLSNIELVIIDDKSTDNSIAVIESFNDMRIRLVKLKENHGISNALNEGISHARSSYIARMDADDIANRNRLFLQYNFLSKNREVGVVGSWIKCFGNKNYTHDYPTEDNSIKMNMFFQNPIAHPSVMFRKEIVLSVGGYNSLYDSVEDWELWSRLIKTTKFRNLPEYLIHYRIHRGNKSFLDSKRSSLLKIKLMRHIFLDNNLPFDSTYFDGSFFMAEGNFEKIYKYFEELKKINFNKKLFLSDEFNELLQKMLNAQLLKSDRDYLKLYFKFWCFRLTPISCMRDLKFSMRFFLTALLRSLVKED